MLGKLRNMTALYLLKDEDILLLFREGGKVVDRVWTGSAGGHFEQPKLNDAKACILRELKEELDICESDLEDLALRYVTLRMTKGEIRQNYYFFAKMKNAPVRSLVSNEGKLQWFPLNTVLDLEMPHTAKYMLHHFLSCGRYSDALYVGTATDTGVDFIALPET